MSPFSTPFSRRTVVRIKPFTALRPPAQFAHLLASPPYDTLDDDEARALAGGNKKSFVRIIRPEVDLPPETDVHSDVVYARGAANFAAFKAEGLFVREALPCLYVYRQTLGDHRQVGIVACCHAADYERKIIVRHEKTRPDKQEDRRQHITSLNANAGPVFLTYADRKAIDALVAEIESTIPLYDVTAHGGVQHTLWRVPGEGDLAQALAGLERAYIADGHHRAAAAATVASERGSANPNPTGEEEYNWFLAVLFPASQLKVLPYNRAVRDLNGLSEEAFLDAVREHFDVSEDAPSEPAGAQRASMYLGGKWYGLSWDIPADANPVSALDVSVLQDRLLGPLLGIDDPRTNERISFVGGIRGTQELEARVDSGRDRVAFSVYPVSVRQIMDVSDSGEIMPPKSTWFEPKLLSGLLVHELD
jgi:uncharacterized protein (DUF1015 family)